MSEANAVESDRLVRLQTECGGVIWCGFFGKNENGDHDECCCEIIEDVEECSLEVDEDGSMRPCYTVECPDCGRNIEWGQEWEEIPLPNVED